MRYNVTLTMVVEGDDEDSAFDNFVEQIEHHLSKGETDLISDMTSVEEIA